MDGAMIAIARMTRKVERHDLPALASLLDQLGYAVGSPELAKRWDAVLGAEDHCIFVAGADGHAVGLLHVFARPSLEKGMEAVVQLLVVDHAARGQGVGQALMQAAEQWAASRGVGSVALYTRIDREQARAFYERIGYRLRATSHLLALDIT
jgi:GNAT superfamily N-acetyltransferase